MQPTWDLFCRVIDNYGDIGVCWRLARQLAGEHGLRVRLWVDDLNSLRPLLPETDPSLDQQQQAGVDIRHWRADSTFDRAADVVIEAFACDLPPAYLAAMAARAQPPRWINLEYLTAESWAESCHGMASPHPSLPLVKHFFFPGFTPSTGGLLREVTLPIAPPRPRRSTLEMSLFCYETAPMAALIATLADSPGPIRCHVPPGKPLAAVRAHLRGEGPWQVGQLTLLPLPFLPLDAYDTLLQNCDLNFVRGEDSFVRAQWAGRPFVWHIYKQDDNAHLDKLDAFLTQYTRPLPERAAACLIDLHHAWNDQGDLRTPLRAYLENLPVFSTHATAWAKAQAVQPDLATRLVNFCAPRV